MNQRCLKIRLWDFKEESAEDSFAKKAPAQPLASLLSNP